MTVFRNNPPKDVHLSSGSCQVDITEEEARHFFHELGVLLGEKHPAEEKSS